MTRAPDEIIRENLRLPQQFLNRSVIDMLKRQDELIEEYCAQGFTREQFFEHARRLGLR